MHIFYNCRYVHCSKLVTEDVTCEEAADLAVAADFFLIDSLKRECKEIIREDISADVVWPVLNKLLKANLSEIADETCSVRLDNFFLLFEVLY